MGVLLWPFGTVFAKRLDDKLKRQIGAHLEARITYRAQCDNFDRLGHLLSGLGADGPRSLRYRKDRVRCVRGGDSWLEHRLRPGARTTRIVSACCHGSSGTDVR